MDAEEWKRRLDALGEPMPAQTTLPAAPAPRADALRTWLLEQPGIRSALVRDVHASVRQQEGVSAEIDVADLGAAHELAAALPQQLGPDVGYWARVTVDDQVVILTPHTEAGFGWAWSLLATPLPSGVSLRAVGNSKGAAREMSPWLLLVGDDPRAIARGFADEYDALELPGSLRIVDRRPSGRFEFEQALKDPAAVDARVGPGQKIADGLRFHS